MTREEKIQTAMKNAESKWDELYTQEEWGNVETEEKKMPKSHRVRGGYASKAMKNAYGG